MILSLENFKRLPIHLFSLFLVIQEIFPRYDNATLRSYFGMVVTTGF